MQVDYLTFGFTGEIVLDIFLFVQTNREPSRWHEYDVEESQIYRLK